MSFSSDIKKELSADIPADKNAKKQLLYGLLYCFKICTATEISHVTENKSTVFLVSQLLKDFFPNDKFSVKIISQKPRSLYSVTLKNPSFIERINAEFALDIPEINSKIIDGGDESSALFIRGLFLVCGSVTDPNRGYHAEFVPPDSERAGRLFEFFNEHGFRLKQTLRKSQSVLYIKESEVIEDLLTFMGAASHSLEIMNVKIYKDFRNKVNRKVNFESANLDKTIAAAQKQADDIRLILDNGGRTELSAELFSLAMLRLENPEMSLKELGERCNPPIGRSGVNHRFQKIAQIADKYR